MPEIKSSAELRNNYNMVSEFCHKYNEPVFITKNGKGDLAIMSIEAYEELKSRYELYDLLQKGLQDVENGNFSKATDFIAELKAKRKIK